VFATGQLRTVFDRLDGDRSGCITPDELISAVRGVSGEGAAQMIRRVDTNHDNCVDFAEFCDAFRFIPFASFVDVAAVWQTLPDLDCGTDVVPPLPQQGVPPVFGVIGGVAGIVAKTMTAPLERVKLVAQTSRVSSVSIAAELAHTRKQFGLKGVWYQPTCGWYVVIRGVCVCVCVCRVALLGALECACGVKLSQYASAFCGVRIAEKNAHRL
jgi:hypothetical protein